MSQLSTVASLASVQTTDNTFRPDFRPDLSTALHYTDAAAAAKLHLLTVSERTFDELVEFGFPLDVADPSYKNPRRPRQQSVSSVRSIQPESPGLFDKSPKGGLEKDPKETHFFATKQRPRRRHAHSFSKKLSINTGVPYISAPVQGPASVHSYNGNSNLYDIQSLHSPQDTQSLQSLQSPQSPHYTHDRPHSATSLGSRYFPVSAVPREMTLKVTLTPAAMRADEAVLYGWIQGPSGSSSGDEPLPYPTSLSSGTANSPLRPTFSGMSANVSVPGTPVQTHPVTSVSSTANSGVPVAPGVVAHADRQASSFIPVGGFGKDTGSKKVIMKRVFGKFAAKKAGKATIITSSDVK